MKPILWSTGVLYRLSICDRSDRADFWMENLSMKTVRTTGVGLAIAILMSSQGLADEASVRAHLAASDVTTYLQQGDVRIELLETGTNDPSDALVFQKFIGDLPLHGGHVVVIENADGTVAQVFDDSTAQLVVRRGLRLRIPLPVPGWFSDLEMDVEIARVGKVEDDPFDAILIETRYTRIDPDERAILDRLRDA